MVMPIYDDAPLRYLRRPIVNWTLIALNVIIFLVVQSEIFGDPLTVVRGFAIIPRVLFGEAQLADWIVGPPAALTLVTALFFHSSVVHLGSNMLFLYVFGDNVEDAMGFGHHPLAFHLSCGVASGVFYIYGSTPHLILPLIGELLGAISGVRAAFLLLHPRGMLAPTSPALAGARRPVYLGCPARRGAAEVDTGAGVLPPSGSSLPAAFCCCWIGDAAHQRVDGARVARSPGWRCRRHCRGFGAWTPTFKRRRHRLFTAAARSPPRRARRTPATTRPGTSGGRGRFV